MDTFDYTFIDDTIHFLLLLLIDRYISLTKILSNAAIILVNILYILTQLILQNVFVSIFYHSTAMYLQV